MFATPDSRSPQTFTARESTLPRAVLLIALGIACTGGLFLYFLSLVNRPARPGDDLLPGLIGGASVIGIGLLAWGLFLLRSTTRVVVDDHALHVHTFFRYQSVPWTDAAEVRTGKRSALMAAAGCKTLDLVDRSGRILARVSDTVHDFDRLLAEASARATSISGQVAYDPVADEHRRLAGETRKIRRIAWIFLAFTLGMIAAFGYGIYEEVHTRRYATEAVRTDARLVRRWMVNVTPHVEYAFTDPAGQSHSRDAMMYQGPAYDALEGRPTVPIEYLPSDPSWNRLVTGEDPGPQFGGKFLLLTAFGTLMFGTLFVTSFLGYDLKQQNGVHTLTRHGKPLKSWGTPITPGR